MALPRAPKVKDAHYHAIRATERWSELVAAEQAARINSLTEDERRQREREHETTYARHELGAH